MFSVMEPVYLSSDYRRQKMWQGKTLERCVATGWFHSGFDLLGRHLWKFFKHYTKHCKSAKLPWHHNLNSLLGHHHVIVHGCDYGLCDCRVGVSVGSGVVHGGDGSGFVCCVGVVSMVSVLVLVMVPVTSSHQMSQGSPQIFWAQPIHTFGLWTVGGLKQWWMGSQKAVDRAVQGF